MIWLWEKNFQYYVTIYLCTLYFITGDDNDQRIVLQLVQFVKDTTGNYCISIKLLVIIDVDRDNSF